MQDLKYIPKIFNKISDKEIIHYNGYRLKTAYLINIVDVFLSKYVFLNSDKISLSSKIMKSNYGDKYNYYINYLIEKDVIKLWKNYSTGRHSRIYKLTDKTKKNITHTEITIPTKLKNKIKNATNKTNTVEQHIQKKLVNDLTKVDIKYKESKDWIKEQNLEERGYLSNMTAIKKINMKNIFYTFDSFGRLHTNFTTLKKHIRNNYLNIDGEQLKEIDITNSQPFFLYLLMKKKGFNEFTNFDKDVLNGIIYDKIADKENITRNKAKVHVYSVLFGRNKNSKSDIMFKSMYPKVYNWIKEYKCEHKNYKIVAQILQKIESTFVFNNLINEVILYNKNIPIITIHDAILIPEKYYEKVLKIFIKEINKLLD